MMAAVLLMASCTKDHGNTTRANEMKDFGNMARVQIYNTAPGTARTFAYADAKRLNGAAFIYSNTAHTGSGLSYAVMAGLRAFVVRDTLGSSIQPQISFAEDFQANKNYTIFLYDTMSAIKQKTVMTDIVKTNDNTTTRVRFANFTWLKGGTPPNVDLYSKNQNSIILSDVPYTGVTDFVTLPTGATDSLFVRETGTMTNLAAGAFTFMPNESYTVVYRGRYNPGTFAKTLASFINY